MTRLVKLPFAVTLVLVSSLATAYGCGDGDGGTNDDPKPLPDGAIPGADGAIPGTDGASSDGNAHGDGNPNDDPDGGANGGDSGVDSGPLSLGYTDFSINHVLITGQSNSVANGSTPTLSTTQPYTNLMFNTGGMPMQGTPGNAAANCNGEGCTAYQTPTSFVALVENDNFFNYDVETPAAGLANEVSRLAVNAFGFGTTPGYPAKHDVLVSNHGRSGNTYWCLRKGGCNYKVGYLAPFEQAMKEVDSGKALALAVGRTYVVRGVVAIHAESDHYSYVGNRTEFPNDTGSSEFPLTGTDGTAGKIASYKEALIEWQQDYEASIKAKTSQTQPVPLFINAISGWNSTRTSGVAQMQLDAHIAAPGKVIYVTPAYPMTFKNDCLHFDSHGSRRLGEYFGKVYAKVVLGGQTWEPVRPKTITRVGNVVTVKYFVPAPPLVTDTVKVTNPGNLGFDFLDTGTMATISTVAVTSADTVTITLAAAPSGTNMRLRYAQNQPVPGCIGSGTQAGLTGGARGNIRDSDNTTSQYGYDMYNWGVNFDIAVP